MKEGEGGGEGEGERRTASSLRERAGVGERGDGGRGCGRKRRNAIGSKQTRCSEGTFELVHSNHTCVKCAAARAMPRISREAESAMRSVGSRNTSEDPRTTVHGLISVVCTLATPRARLHNWKEAADCCLWIFCCVAHSPRLVLCMCVCPLPPPHLCCLCCLLCLPWWNNSRGRDSSELCIGA